MKVRIVLFCLGLFGCADGLAMNLASSKEWKTVRRNNKRNNKRANKVSVTIEYIDQNFLEACAFGNVAQVQNNLQHNRIDINGRSKKGFTPLTTAIYNWRNNMAVALIAAGANVNKPNNDKKGFPPLTVAVTKGNLGAVSMLLDYGANVDQRDSQGSTPLMYAAEAADLPKVALLVNKGAKVNAQDFEKLRTPLHWALRMHKKSRKKKGIQHSDQEVLATLKILVEHGANPTIKDRKNKSPIEWAHYLYFPEAENLMREAVDVNH